MMELQKHVIIVAGGGGKRMESDMPKQFLLLNDKPILFHTFQAFLFLRDVKFTLVLNSTQIDYWKNICVSFGFNIPHNIAEGGPSRFHSVKSGLKHIPNNSLVLIHDAVRPFVSQETIKRVVDMAIRKGNAAPAIGVMDSIREILGSNSRIINRNKLRAIQTPQAFNSTIIKAAYNSSYNPNFTDDTSVLESDGVKINLVEGNQENIKISNPFDLVLGKSILESNY